VNSTANVTVAVVVPCFNEEGYLEDLLATLIPQIEGNDRWSVVLVNDSSTDATPAIVEAAAAHPQVHALHGRYGSPGDTRTAGAACAIHGTTSTACPDWIVTVDADIELAPNWRVNWDATLHRVHADERCGAINGVELQDHLFTDYPNAKQVSAAFGLALGHSETVVGITNLNGVNHGVRTSAYLTAGPYLQPTAPGPTGPLSLAGEDWDLGVRLRSAGYEIAETEAAVIDRGRRLLNDVYAYVSGEAYEGAFRRLEPRAKSVDVEAHARNELIDHAVDRSLRHFYFKPILAELVPLTSEATGLSSPTLTDMRTWMNQWPHPTFPESRNGFIFGRLERFAKTFSATVRTEHKLELPHILAALRAEAGPASPES
jgi:glycosyltransferase involved in cell wall biosynthesis